MDLQDLPEGLPISDEDWKQTLPAVRAFILAGGVQRCVDRVSEAIRPYYVAIAVRARSIKVNFIDETSWYQHGVLACLWVMVNHSVAYFVTVHRAYRLIRRSRKAERFLLMQHPLVQRGNEKHSCYFCYHQNPLPKALVFTL